MKQKLYVKRIVMIFAFLTIFSFSVSGCIAHIPEIVLEDRDYIEEPIIVEDPETSYAFYGANMSNFDALPTWVYATPHNIQLQTPQMESCHSCHENADIFLTQDKVSAKERKANQSVIITDIPELIMDSFGE